VSFVAVLPSIWPEWTELCLASMSYELLSQTVVVDNAAPNRNLGVAASWNVGARILQQQEADWLVIISAAMRFGAPGGRDFLAELDAAPAEAWAIEAGPCPRWPGMGFGWHLIAFRASTFERVGLFDENFWPAYFEDLDFGHRIRCASGWAAGEEPMWPKVDVDADLAGFAHGIHLAGVEQDPSGLIRYYSRKWGVPPGAPASEVFYTNPFGDPKFPLSYWPEPDPRNAT
jgi:hypothetical protein